MLRPRILLALVTLGHAVSGCSGGVCPRVRFTDPAELEWSYASMRSPARVVRAEARVERRDAGGRIRGTVFMMLERPDHVRFDAMTQFGPAAILTSDGATFALTDLRENRFFVGPTCAENIERLLGIPMEGEDVARLLLGEALRFSATGETVTCEGGRYRIDRTGEDGTSERLELEVRPADVEAEPAEQRLRLRRAEVREPGGAVLWTVTWDDYRVVEDPLDVESPRRGVAMPHRIRFVHPARGIDTDMRIESMEINVEVPGGAFQQEPRGGLSIEPVECSR